MHSLCRREPGREHLAAGTVPAGGRLTGLYTFKDSFGHQDSVVFSGALTGRIAQVMITAVRADGSSNFTADMIGTPASMTGQMMLGTSQRPVRLCTLGLTATR
jgi:hypothetical protein